MKDAFTTGEVAKFCGVNFRTVIRWIEKGYIEAYKLPGRGDNRVPIKALIDFLNKNAMPVPDEVAELASSLEEDAGVDKEPVKNDKLRVLIIEDEELMSKSMQRSIARAGYDVEWAANGIEAGIKLETFKPEIITLDLQMPGMSGFEVLEVLHGTERYQDIKVLVVSASTKIKMIEAMSLGVDDILEKPFVNEELVNKINTLAEKKRLA